MIYVKGVIKMKTTVKVSSKYQIVIPREARKYLNLKEGDELIVKADEEKITIYPQPKSYAKYSLGLGKENWKDVEAIEYVKKERETWKR